jgi:plasmid stabilization system protein ParE
MRIRWTPAAAADLKNISTYLKDTHPPYRQPTMRKLYETIRSLTESPHRGRLGREEGTRELCSLLCRMSLCTA